MTHRLRSYQPTAPTRMSQRRFGGSRVAHPALPEHPWEQWWVSS